MAKRFPVLVVKVRKIKIAAFIFIGILLTYILSVGPSHRLLCKGRLPQGVFFFVYDPLLYVCKQNEHIDNLLNRYEDFWFSMWDQPSNEKQNK